MRYLHRCPEHGDFEVNVPMRDARQYYGCPHNDYNWKEVDPLSRETLYWDGPICGVPSPQVMSCRIHYPYGREEFHDGTVRERSEFAIKEAKQAGLDPVPVSNADLSQRHDAGHGRVYYDGTNPAKEQKQRIRKAAEKALQAPTGTW